MTFECVDEQQCVGVHVQIWFGPLLLVGLGYVLSVEQLACFGTFFLDDYALIFVDFESRMKTEDCRIRIGVRRESVEFEPSRFLSDSSIECFELVTLEWSCLVDLMVEELDDDPLFLDVSNAKAVV